MISNEVNACSIIFSLNNMSVCCPEQYVCELYNIYSNGVQYWPKISITMSYCSTICPWISTLHCRTVVFIIVNRWCYNSCTKFSYFCQNCTLLQENIKVVHIHETDIEIIREKFKICTEKIDKEVVAQNVVADFGLQLMLANMKLVNENTPKEMINLRMNCLKRGLSDFKMKSLEKDRKKWLQNINETKPTTNQVHSAL